MFSKKNLLNKLGPLACAASLSMAALPAVAGVKVEPVYPKDPHQEKQNALVEEWLSQNEETFNRLVKTLDPETMGDHFIVFSPESVGAFKDAIRAELGELTYRQLGKMIAYLDSELVDEFINRTASYLKAHDLIEQFDMDKVITDELFHIGLSALYDLEVPRYHIDLPKVEPTGDHFLMHSPEKIVLKYHLREQLEIFAKWQSQVDALFASGAKVTVIDGADTEGNYREVWTKDKAYTNPNTGKIYIYKGATRAVAYPPKAIGEDVWMNIEDVVKNAEELSKYLEDHAYDVERFNTYPIEFGNLAYDQSRNRLLVAYGHEISGFWHLSIISELSEELGHGDANETSLALSTPPEGVDESDWFYHLDCCLAVLPPIDEQSESKILFVREGLSPDFAKLIEQIYGKENIIEVSTEDGLKLATNVRVVGNRVLSPYLPDYVIEKLQASGYEAVTPKTLNIHHDSEESPWKLSNASISCATLELPKQEKK